MSKQAEEAARAWWKELGHYPSLKKWKEWIEPLINSELLKQRERSANNYCALECARAPVPGYEPDSATCQACTLRAAILAEEE